MVDANVAAAIAEGRVPQGITAAYLEQSRDEGAITAIIVLTVLATIVLLLRWTSRVFLMNSFGLDDGLALLSYALFITFVALCFVLIGEGSGRHIEYIQFVLTYEETNQTEVNDYVAHLIYTTALFVCRLSGLAFFHRLTLRHQPLLRAIRLAGIFLVCAFLPQFFLILAHCNPVTGLWPYAWQPNSNDYKCITWGTVYVTNSGLSLVCDLVLFSIPVAMIHLLKLSRGRKIMLAFVLMPGVAVIGISASRLYLCVVGQWASDGSWYYDPQLVIEVAEVGGTLMALSVPGLKPMLRLVHDKVRSMTNSSWRRSQDLSDPERLGYGQKLSEVSSRRRSRWMEYAVFGGVIHTSVKADKTTNSGKSDIEEVMDPRDIRVQTEVDQSSTPREPIYAETRAACSCRSETSLVRSCRCRSRSQ